jgi:HAD superfamily hydrolase (TIGR01458 family)
VNESIFEGVKGFLFDLDGVFHIGDELIPGAVEALGALRSRGFACRFATNTTTVSLGSLHRRIAGMGLPVEKDEIFSSPQAAIRYLRRQKNPVCHLVLTDDAKKDFAEFPQSDTRPAFVVMGDVEEKWNRTLLNSIFRMLIGGAALLALHKGKYWETKEGLRLDIGVFVAGLEYVTGRQAIVMGKPSPEFFHQALSDMGLSPREVVMIGDDIDSDVGGAQKAGMRGVLVRTGKYREDLAARSPVRPDAVISSISALPGLL